MIEMTQEIIQTPSSNIYDENISSRVALYINSFLRREGISATTLSEKIGITKYQLSKIRSGKSNATVKILKVCAEQLGANASWLLTGKGAMFSCEKGESY